MPWALTKWLIGVSTAWEKENPLWCPFLFICLCVCVYGKRYYNVVLYYPSLNISVSDTCLLSIQNKPHRKAKNSLYLLFFILLQFTHVFDFRGSMMLSEKFLQYLREVMDVLLTLIVVCVHVSRCFLKIAHLYVYNDNG